MFSRPLTRLLISSTSRRTFGTRARAQRNNNTQQQQQWNRARLNMNAGRRAAAIALSGGIAFVLHASTKVSDNKMATPSQVDYDQVRKSIVDLLEDNDYDDGSYGPLFVRLGWHASGTYSHIDSSGGSNGGCMRFEPESGWGANKGLKIARDRLESVYKAHPGLTYADLYTLAAVVAIEEMGGPPIKWRPGRNDHEDGKKSPADGRLPDAARGAEHVRDIFQRMGFNDKETVALIGAHSLGRCHTDRSGYEGPWTFAPTTFSNEFFRLLLEEKWQERKWKGPKQFEDVKTKTLMMLPADMALIQDPEFKKYVVEYAKDDALFAKDFASAFGKLLELGVDFTTTDGSKVGKNASWWSRIFGGHQ